MRIVCADCFGSDHAEGDDCCPSPRDECGECSGEGVLFTTTFDDDGDAIGEFEDKCAACGGAGLVRR